MPNYYLHRSENSVDLWLDRRLPLEPKGSVLVARKDLQAAIREMHVPNGAVLCSTYTSLDNTFCDVENVLIYNVGTGTFKHATGGGILVKRIRSEPIPSPTGSRFGHHHRYSFVDTPLKPTGPGNITFSFPLPSICSTTKVHDVWMRATEAAAIPHQKLIAGRYSIHIELGVVKAITNVAGVLKQLLDGIVSSLHYDEVPSYTAIQRLSNHCKWTEQEIMKRICTPPNPILGNRRVLNEYQKFVKWDPADHLCEEFTLLVTQVNTPLCVVTLTEI